VAIVWGCALKPRQIYAFTLSNLVQWIKSESGRFESK
jgi:G:T-mismatch repair DNA endonuclease (very short patch repair protein)